MTHRPTQYWPPAIQKSKKRWADRSKALICKSGLSKRESIVYVGCREKFSQNPRLQTLLLATASTELVEASPYDLIWGVGLGERDPLILDKSNWRGTNPLGITLMKVRDTLRST
jgi:ribA/ribD-fused uncharacterized protein